MNRRTLLLLLAASSIGLLYGADQAYRKGYEAPLDRLNSRIDGLALKQRRAAQTQAEARRDVKRLDIYAALSLPYDLEKAKSAYQDWLLSLVAKLQMTQASVDPGQPRALSVRNRTQRGERQVATRLPFTLRAKTDLAQLTSFLQAFEGAGHLHKIVSLTINPIGSGFEIDVTMVIEALALDACEREAELSTLAWNRNVSEASSFASIARRNPFARGFSKTLAETRLTAITYGNDGEAEAWFRVGQENRTRQTRAGERLQLELVQIEVIDILPEKLFVRIDGKSAWMTIGATLGSLVDQPSVAAEIDPTTTDRQQQP